MKSQWRRLTLAKQGLASNQSFGSGLNATRKAIHHLGYVQIDTLSVVERAHHHTLWNRVNNYDPIHLNKLIQKKHIFEYWYHAASYLPMRNYRFALPQMTSIRDGEHRYYQNVDSKLINEILARVKGEGGLRVRDLDKSKSQKAGNWWNSGPGRRALDKLFMQGDLMVSKRNGMEKTYDLAERCLPEDIDLSMPTVREYASYLFDTTLRAHGVFTWKQLLHLKTGKPLRDAMREVLTDRIDEGVITEIEHEGFKGFIETGVIESKDFDNKHKNNEQLKILSPFDNAVIHRDRLSSLFEFDYRIECYVPAAKRIYGYFCLPIQFENEMVARIDCKAHRQEQRLEVLSLHLENRPINKDVFYSKLTDELHSFANFNQCLEFDDSAIKRIQRRKPSKNRKQNSKT